MIHVLHNIVLGNIGDYKYKKCHIAQSSVHDISSYKQNQRMIKIIERLLFIYISHYQVDCKIIYLQPCVNKYIPFLCNKKSCTFCMQSTSLQPHQERHRGNDYLHMYVFLYIRRNFVQLITLCGSTISTQGQVVSIQKSFLCLFKAKTIARMQRYRISLKPIRNHWLIFMMLFNSFTSI